MEVALFGDNLRPFLTTIGWLVNGHLDEDDWKAISAGLRDTDREKGRWYEYEYAGEKRTLFAVARDDDGASISWFRADLSADYLSRVQLLADFCWHFHWRE